MSEEDDSSEQGVGNDNDIIEPNKTKYKIIRVLTVIAYTLSVSMAAILLSIYYILMWDGHPTLARKDPSHAHPMAQHQYQEQPQLPTAYSPPTTGVALQTFATADADELHDLQHEFDHLSELNMADEGSAKENVLVDVPYEPTAIPVVEAKTEAPPPSTPDPDPDDDDQNAGDWPMNITELTKRSPMFKKLIMSNIMD